MSRIGGARGLGGHGRRRAGRWRARGRLPSPARHGGGRHGELADALAASTGAYRLHLSVDLVFIEALLRHGEAADAADAVEHELQVLHGFAAGLHEVLAAATLERGA